jgi:hypothetical protein
MEMINSLLRRGVRIPNPDTVEIGPEVGHRPGLRRRGGHPFRVPDLRGADPDPAILC